MLGVSPSIVTWSAPSQCHRSCGGTWLQSGREAELEGWESQIPVCGAMIPQQVELEWLGLSIPGAQDRLGGLQTPQSRVIQRHIQDSLCVPGGRSSSHCTQNPARAASREYSGHSLSNSTAKTFPKTELLLLLGRSSGTGKIPGVSWDPVSSAKPKGNSPSVPRLAWDGIPRLHPEVSRTSLWRAADGQGMETLEAQIGKKKKLPKKNPKSPVLPSVSVPKGLGIPVPRLPSERFGVKVQGQSQRTYLKEISFKLLSCSPVASQSNFSHSGQGAVIKILIHQWQCLEHTSVPGLEIPTPWGSPSS